MTQPVTRRRNILQLMRDREINDQFHSKCALKNKIETNYISKLGLSTELKGHRGCVNCLQWNEKGSILASASDDFQVILWDPFLRKAKTAIKTLHRGNIFTVKFLPNSYEDVVATGAADWSLHTYNVSTGERLSVCTCAQGRVKRIAVANDTPHVFWNASEDGCIRQYDTRMSHDCTHEPTKSTLVSIYGTSGTLIEAKCLDINQLRTEQLAVGANDPYVRLYDRRMIRSLSSFRIKYPYPKNLSDLVIKFNDDKREYKTKLNGRTESIVQYFVPGHVHSNEPNTTNKNKNIGITYLTFSPDGQELLVNYGGDYVYLYNLSHQVESAFCNIPKVMREQRQNGEGSSTDLLEPVPLAHLELPYEVEQLKLKANYLFEKTEYTAAINLYNDAISICKSSVLFSNRAAAYIKRKWHGDFYAALKDCVTALRLEPNHMKAHFRLAVCLYELNKLEDSKMYLDQFTTKYPLYKTSVAFKVLHKDLIQAKTKNKEKINEKQFFETLRAESDKREDGLKHSQIQRMMFEEYLRTQAKDYHNRYYGHCNTSTDIKEANFFGSQSQFIVAGSDDGLFFIWDKKTENNLLILKGDSSIVNCLQPHPSEFMLATSGIDNEVKLWTPEPDEFNKAHVVEHYKKTAIINQRRMVADPFEIIMRSMRRSAYEDIDMDGQPDVDYEMLPIPDQFYACRTS